MAYSRCFSDGTIIRFDNDSKFISHSRPNLNSYLLGLLSVFGQMNHEYGKPGEMLMPVKDRSRLISQGWKLIAQVKETKT